MVKTILRRKNKAGGLRAPKFKTDYKVTLIKIVGTDIKTDIETNGIE